MSSSPWEPPAVAGGAGVGAAGGCPRSREGVPRVSGGGQPRGTHGRREIYGCKWTQVRVKVRDALLMGKKLRGNIAVPSGQEEKSVRMPSLAEREGKESGEDSKRWGRVGGKETSSFPGCGSDAHGEKPHGSGSGRAGAGRDGASGAGSGWCRAGRAARRGRASGGRAGNREKGAPYARGYSRGRAKPSGSRFAWLEPKGEEEERLEPARPAG